MEYVDFLRRKSVMAQPCGFDSRPNQLSPKLFDWQRDVTSWAIQRGRAGLFEDCGLGKTAQQVTWANTIAEHTGSPVLLLAPLAVSRQTQREGTKFGVQINVAETAADIKKVVNVTN